MFLIASFSFPNQTKKAEASFESDLLVLVEILVQFVFVPESESVFESVSVFVSVV